MFKSKKNFCKRTMRILLIAVVGTGIMMFTGCGTVAGESTSTEDSNSHLTSNDSIQIWTDSETGVQYVIYKGYRKGGITPRLNVDGTLYTINQDKDEKVGEDYEK